MFHNSWPLAVKALNVLITWLLNKLAFAYLFEWQGTSNYQFRNEKFLGCERLA